jgi:hypothetical protein
VGLDDVTIWRIFAFLASCLLYFSLRHGCICIGYTGSEHGICSSAASGFFIFFYIPILLMGSLM